MLRNARYSVGKNTRGFYVIDNLTGEMKHWGLATSEVAITRRNELEARNDRTRRGER